MYIHMYIHMKRKNLKRKSANNDPRRRENKRELLKVSTWRRKIDFTFPIIFVYYSPGDRAQKVRTRGAKTNESFWNSQNDVKKSILHFPLFLFTIALVIERKKLSPEARKQTRASESLKITSKSQFYVSHHFFDYSPGDRAQKVITGGAKTNESLWKSHNNVKKSILRFPTVLFTIALVIERKKLSPEARKQTRASERLKITSKNQCYVSQHFCLL